MSLINAALSDKPKEWQMVSGKYDASVIVSRYTVEYDEIVAFVKTNTVKTCDVQSIVRVQNSNSWAQFLYRCQYLKISGAVYHVVRKLVKVKDYNLRNALKHKLDPRRVSNTQLKFHSRLQTLDRDDVLLIVLVVTNDVYGDVTPTRDNEYYIEYYVQFE